MSRGAGCLSTHPAGEREDNKEEREAAQQHRVSQMSCLPATLRGSPIVALFRKISAWLFQKLAAT